MAKNTPSPAGLRLWRERLQRATRKQEPWLKETQDAVDLINNAPGAWSKESPVRGDSTGKTTLIVRNTLGQNARSEVNRLMPKNPKWIADAVVPFVYETVEGQDEPVEQDNGQRSLILQIAMNYVSEAIDLPEVLEEMAFDGEGGNVSFVMSGYEGAGDISHTAPTPYDSRDEGESGDLNAAERRNLKRPGTAHGSVKPYLPTNVRLQRDKVLVDPDAGTPKAVNWMAHLVARPLPTMKAEKVNEIVDEEIPGPDGMPMMAQNVRTRDKYMNLGDLKPNAKPADVSGPNAGNKQPDGYAEDFLHFWEIHYRVRAENPEETKDGFEYWILSMVTHADGGSPEDSPVCIRHEPYPFDVGGFYITMYRAALTVDDLFGFVPGIRDAKGPSALFNTVSSQIADGTVRNKTVHYFNKNILTDEDIEALANAQHTDWVGLDIKQNVPPEMLMGVVPSTPYGPEVIQEQMFLASLSDSQTGRSDNQRGDTSNVRTAAEANIVAQETSGQVAAKQKRFRKAAAEVMRKSMVIFTHVLPEDGIWYIPDTGKPGKFMRFQKRDLFCNADIRMDLTSQVLKDDTVVAQQGMQLMDMTLKVLMAPPQIQQKMAPTVERVYAAMGPDWEGKGKAIFAPEVESASPENEHLMFAAGEYVTPDQNEDLQRHYETHKALLKAAPRDPALSKLFYANSPAMMLLIKHLMETEEIMAAKGMPVDIAPGQAQGGGGKRGRQLGNGSVPQAAPSGAEMQAQASSVQGPARMGMRGRMPG